MGVSQLVNNAYMSQYRERRSFGVRDNAYMHICVASKLEILVANFYLLYDFN
jgi:hypothetical protein